MSAGVTTLLGEVLQPFEYLGCGKARAIARESNTYHVQIPRRRTGSVPQEKIRCVGECCPTRAGACLRSKKVGPNGGLRPPLFLYARHGANNTMEEDMLGRRLALALLGTTLISAPAMAQTNQPAG